MIPILFDDGEKNFISNGLGRLSDCVSFTVTEERNGIYECEFAYPITGVHYDEIEAGRYVYATHDDTGTPQAFEVYGKTAPINGIVTFYGHHISYVLNKTVVMPFTAGSITEAMVKIPQYTPTPSGFTFWTDKATVGPYEVTEPREIRAVLGGAEGSLLDVYGSGDYEWDMLTVKLHQSRGTDSGVEIRYGKNMSDIRVEEDASQTFNAIAPFWAGTYNDEDVVVTLPEGAVIYDQATVRYEPITDENGVVLREEGGEPLEVEFKIYEVIPLDMSDQFEEMPSVADLRAAAVAWLESSGGWVPTENITVDFVQMWQTDEYKEYAPLQRVRLCDTVSVFYPELGVAAVKKKVVKTVYNTLMDRYDQIELGDLQYSFGEVITNAILQDVPSTGMMEEAIEHATQLISGGLGGYVILKPNAAGEPEEILIMDEPDIDEAVNVIRMNQNGIGFSTNGYQGPFTTAWTIDGAFVADFITSGTLNANVIRAGVLADVGGNTTFNLATGLLTMTKGSISLGNKFSVNDQGQLVATDVDLGGFKLTNGVDGKFAFTADNGSYRTWIRSATSADGADTWAFSAQQLVDGQYRGNFYVTAAGEMFVGPYGGERISAEANGTYLSYGSYGLNLDSNGVRAMYSGTARLKADSTGVYLRYGNQGFEVSSDGVIAYVPNCSISMTSGNFLLLGGEGDVQLTATSNTISMSSAVGQVLANAYGLTIITGRSTTAHYGNLYITGAGIAYYAKEGSSSRKLKKNIGPVEDEQLDPARLYDAEIVQFQFREEELDEDDENRGKTLIGFIVEDLDEVYPAAVQKEDPEESKTWTWSPHMMIPPMLKLIQEQKKEIDELKAEIAEIKEVLYENKPIR